jgi:hypothetical protein
MIGSCLAPTPFLVPFDWLREQCIGVITRVHLRDELFDAEKKRVRSDKLFLIGRMASPHWYCRTRDRFEMVRPD